MSTLKRGNLPSPGGRGEKQTGAGPAGKHAVIGHARYKIYEPARPRARRRAYLAIGLIALVALSNLRLPLRTFRQLRQSRGTSAAFLERCRRLAPRLPPGGALGYLAAFDKKDIHLRLLRYAFAPRAVEEFSGQRLVIVEAKDSPAALKLAENRGWWLMADDGQGLVAFRTGAR